MTNETALFAGMVLIVAYTVRGIAGFGSGLIAIPLLALQFPLTFVVPLVVLLDYLGSATQGLKHRAFVSWRDLAPLLPFTVAGVATALFLLTALDSQLLTRALGFFVLVYAVYQLLPTPELQGSRVASVPYGFLGGLVGTLFGTGGPFYVIYLTLRGLDKGEFRASFAIYFLVDGTMRLIGYGAVGLFTSEALTRALLAVPAAAIGLFIGGRIHTTLSPQVFKRLISLLLLASGTALLVKA